MGDNDIKVLVLTGTIIFLIAPAFLVLYILVYNRRKKKHAEEKQQMEFFFDNEIIKTQQEVREQTMQTIGADLHDNVGQLLSLTSLTLKSISADDPEMMIKKINAAIELTSRSIQEMRLLGKLLQGEHLVALGLTEAIRHEVQWVEKTGQYEIVYLVDGLELCISNPEKDLIIFRILQETLNNAIKHSQATQIMINLDYRDNQLKLVIKDNGVGFEIKDFSWQLPGMGLQNIRKRAEMVTGQTIIKSDPGNGTTIEVLIPYP